MTIGTGMISLTYDVLNLILASNMLMKKYAKIIILYSSGLEILN